MKNALIILAEGFEEIEAITVIDLLRRAEIDVTVAGLSGQNICASRKTQVTSDTLLEKVAEAEFDIIILPGGQPGANNLMESKLVIRLIQKQVNMDKWLAAICAAPLVLQAAGVLKGKRMTSFPGLESHFEDSIYLTDSVVVDKRIITSRAVGTALDFAISIIENLCGKAMADTIAGQVLMKQN